MAADSTEFDVVIIGAGAAGIAAGRALREAGLRFVILEARARTGGRARTVATRHGPLDLGCEWLHSADRNPLTVLAKQSGFALDDASPGWGRLDNSGLSAAQKADWDRAYEDFQSRLRRAAAETDRPAAELLEDGSPWNGLLDAISSWANGTELDSLSVVDYVNYADSGVNWRVRAGYGSLIAALGRDLPCRFDTPARSVDHHGTAIRVETRSGAARSHTLLVTVSTNLLAAGSIRFIPELTDKAAAAAALPLGLANKLFLRIGEVGREIPENSHVLGKTDRSATGSYQLRPSGRSIIEGFYGGALARELEKAGPSEMADFACEELAGIFGSGIRRHLHFLAASAWDSDPWARGAYSHALPGHAEDRARLARPVDDRIFFAGEACSPHDFSTAHGAFLSGEAAARRIIASLKRA